jgi:hypothetical protein
MNKNPLAEEQEVNKTFVDMHLESDYSEEIKENIKKPKTQKIKGGAGKEATWVLYNNFRKTNAAREKQMVPAVVAELKLLDLKLIEIA